jgi:hypothetical protein
VRVLGRESPCCFPVCEEAIIHNEITEIMTEIPQIVSVMTQISGEEWD